MKNILSYLFIMFLVLPPSVSEAQNGKTRTIVTTDGELDDVDSFIRMLLYANEYNVEVFCHFHF